MCQLVCAYKSHMIQLAEVVLTYPSTQTTESEHDMDANKRFDRERAARIKPSPRNLQQRWDLGTLTTIVLGHFMGPKK